MARAVGLDIGSRTIKVVELNGSPKAFKVLRVITRPDARGRPQPAEGETPKELDELVSDEIREIFQTLKLPKDDVCASFDSGVTIFREIVVPFLEDDQIRKVVKFEAEHHLHSQTIEDVIVNWVKTGESRDGSRLTIFASPKAVAGAPARRPARGGHRAVVRRPRRHGALHGLRRRRGARGEPQRDPGGRGRAQHDAHARRGGAPPRACGPSSSARTSSSPASARSSRSPARKGRRRARLASGPQPDDLLVSTATLSPAGDREERRADRVGHRPRTCDRRSSASSTARPCARWPRSRRARPPSGSCSRAAVRCCPASPRSSARSSTCRSSAST